MGFGSPWFFLGALAVGLPLWLHMLQRFKRTPRPFSSLMFFERRVQTSTRHRRLRYIALLCLRLALLLLLALAFANPFITRPAAKEKRKGITIIAIDRSFSMHYGDRFARAKAEANRLIDASRGSATEVLAFDSRVESLAPPQSSGTALHASVDGLQLSDAASSYGEFSRALRVMESTTGMHLRVHLITDVQQTSMPGAFSDLQVGRHTELTLHPITDKRYSNWAVESVTAPERVSRPELAKVTASFAGWGTNVSSRTASLFIDGRLIEKKDVVVPDCGHATLEWTNFNVPYGFHRGEVRLEPHDSLPQDDSFPFSLMRSDPRTVLFVHRDGRPQESFYYRSALLASPEAALTVRADPFGSLASEDLSRVALIVLNDPGMLEPTLEQKLCDYVAKGGGVFVGVGVSTQRAGRVAVAGESVNGFGPTQGAEDVQAGGAAAPLATPLSNVQFIRPVRLVQKEGDRIVERLADGSPLLIETHHGEGRVLVFATTLDNTSTDFPLHASFLPFISRTGTYLAGESDASSSVLVGSPILLRRQKTDTAAADVLGPDGRHRLQLAQTTRATSFNVEEAGFYDVQRADGHRSLIAVHTDRRESDLTPVAAETVALWSHLGTPDAGADSSSGEWRGDPIRASFWRIALLLVLLVALAESVFASRYLARKEDHRP